MKKGEDTLKEKTRDISIKEGAAAGVMDGAGLKYITPYALAIGANNAQIGFLTSIPSLIGNLSQLFSFKAMEKLSRKKIITLGVIFQAIMWLPIIFVGYLFFNRNVGNGTSVNLMILFYTLLVLFGSFISPAWNSLMKDNVDKERGNYFGKRNKIIGFVSLGIMLICGVILNEFSKSNLFLGFCILFGIAFIFRMISGILITRYHEPELKLEKKYYFSLTQFVRNIPKSNFGKFALSISLITLATSIASPFFSVYLLRNLGISYLNWTIIVIANLVGYYIFMPLWGKFSDKYGNMQVLKWTGFFVAGIPLLWFITSFIVQTNMIIVIGYLILIELFSGFIWAGFNLCATNFIYDAVSREKTALCISYYNVLNGVGVFIGATAGGLIASLNFNILGAGPILIIFLISSILRFLFYILVIPKIKEVRKVIEYRQGEFGKGVKELLFPPFKFMKYSH